MKIECCIISTMFEILISGILKYLIANTIHLIINRKNIKIKEKTKKIIIKFVNLVIDLTFKAIYNHVTFFFWIFEIITIWILNFSLKTH